MAELEGLHRYYCTEEEAAETVEGVQDTMQQMVDVLDEVTTVYEQEIMRIILTGGMPRSTLEAIKPIYIKKQALKEVSDFKYVGSTESNRATMSNEIQIRKQRMAAAYSKYEERVFSNRNTYLRVKLKVCLAFIVSNGIYGCTTWNATQADVHQLESFQRRHLQYAKYSDFDAKIR